MIVAARIKRFRIDMLKADIAKYTTDAAVLTKEIAGHTEDVAMWNGDKLAAL